jgi:hypothetical protein
MIAASPLWDAPPEHLEKSSAEAPRGRRRSTGSVGLGPAVRAAPGRLAPAETQPLGVSAGPGAAVDVRRDLALGLAAGGAGLAWL